MAIVGAFDVHRRQITFDVLDTESGQVRRGQVRPACRATLRQFLARYAGVDEVEFTVEGCTGWRFIVEELERADPPASGRAGADRGCPGVEAAGQDRPHRRPAPAPAAG